MTTAVAPARPLHAAVRGGCRLLLRLLSVRVTVHSAGPQLPALILANHISWLDILAVMGHVPCTFVAKREVQEWPLVGWLGTKLGVVWVDRGRKRDLLQAIPALHAQLAAGHSVVLFPEGTTSNGAQLLPFKSALVEAAVRAHVPVVPLALTASARGDTSALSWTGDETLGASVPRVAALHDAAMVLHFAPALPPGSARKPLTAQARHAIEARTVGGAIRAHPPRAVNRGRTTNRDQTVTRSARRCGAPRPAFADSACPSATDTHSSCPSSGSPCSPIHGCLKSTALHAPLTA